MINRVEFAVQQTIEAIITFCDAKGPIRLDISYDEFVIDAVVTYVGAPLEFPTQPPTKEEIIETDEGHRRLAGFLIRRYADRMEANTANDQDDRASPLRPLIRCTSMRAACGVRPPAHINQPCGSST